MQAIHVKTLGELTIVRGGQTAKLPASRRTRALLGYLLLTRGPHRRERLCELFWSRPADPRGALRWALSKIRPLLDDDEIRLLADRERVSIAPVGLQIDRDAIADELDRSDLAIPRLDEICPALEQVLLDGCDLPDQPAFQEWLNAERLDSERVRLGALRRLATHPDLPAHRVVTQARAWANAEPYSADAARHLIVSLDRFELSAEARECRTEVASRFAEANLDWAAPPQTVHGHPSGNPDQSAARQLRQRQKIRFCTADDSVRIAYATVGQGTPLIKAANWLTHLELDWDAPIWSPLFRELARDHRLVRYDERGNGLSDWDVDDLSFDAFVTDLESVVDAVGEERFALLGISQGAAVSIEYAVRHPQRVSKLILFGGYPAGWRINASKETIAEREAILTLTATGWGQDNPAYRQIFSSTFMPTATPEELEWFNEFQRATTSPENAVKFLSAFGDIDVRHQLAILTVPTLVLHSRGDQRIPFKTGLELATSIPHAEFVGLDSDNHLLLGREPASDDFVAAIKRFLQR